MTLDYTGQGRRPSARQIVADWAKGGCPDRFEVCYGETFAEFEYSHHGWDDFGNGCRGVDRGAVVATLRARGGGE